MEEGLSEAPESEGTMKYRYVHRSAITGRFVSKAYAKRYPDITIRQRLLVKI